MSTKAELACVYASLILVDDDVAVTVSFSILQSGTQQILQSRGHRPEVLDNLRSYGFFRTAATCADLIFWIHQGEKINTILKAANVEVEPYWPGLFAKALEGINVKDLITNIGSGVGAAPAGGAAPAAAAAAPAAESKKEEKKKEEESDQSDDDMGFGLFD